MTTTVPRTVEVELGGRPVTVPSGGLYDRYRMDTDLDEIARDPRVSGVDFFRRLPKSRVDSPIGPTLTPNFYDRICTARLTMIAPIRAVRSRLPDEFIARFAERARRLRIGAAYDFTVDVGSLTTPSQLATVSAHVQDALDRGATLLAGGRARPDLGPLFYEPTILTDVTPAMTMHGHETFGPVVSVYRYRDVDEAVAIANSTPYGLNAGVWGRDGRRARAVAARIHAGTVNVNDAFATAWGSIDAPMGGMGDSGVGRRHGADGLLKYTEPQTVAHQRGHGFAPPAGIGWPRWAGILTALLRAWRRSGAR